MMFSYFKSNSILYVWLGMYWLHLQGPHHSLPDVRSSFIFVCSIAVQCSNIQHVPQFYIPRIGDQPGHTHTEGGQSTVLSVRGGRWSPCTSGFKKRFLLRRRKRELGGKSILIGRKWGTEKPKGRRVHHPKWKGSRGW